MVLKIILRNSKTKEEKEYTQDFIPLKKQVEALKMDEKNFPDLDRAGWVEKNAEFVASLFDNPEVTKNAVLDGVATKDWDDVFNKTYFAVMGVDPKKQASPKKKSQTKKS